MRRYEKNNTEKIKKSLETLKPKVFIEKKISEKIKEIPDKSLKLID